MVICFSEYNPFIAMSMINFKHLDDLHVGIWTLFCIKVIWFSDQNFWRIPIVSDFSKRHISSFLSAKTDGNEIIEEVSKISDQTHSCANFCFEHNLWEYFFSSRVNCQRISPETDFVGISKEKYVKFPMKFPFKMAWALCI